MKNLTSAILAPALLIVVCLSGCVTPSSGIESESTITENKVGDLKKGASRHEVIAILGEPENRLVLENGEALFFKDINLSSVWVRFSEDGKVADWEWSK